jgi:hypothetical protein
MAYYRMYCEACGKYTDHTMQVVGTWEEYTCIVCGHSHGYRVR